MSTFILIIMVYAGAFTTRSIAIDHIGGFQSMEECQNARLAIADGTLKDTHYVCIEQHHDRIKP